MVDGHSRISGGYEGPAAKKPSSLRIMSAIATPFYDLKLALVEKP